MGIFKVMKPLIVEERFKDLIFLLNNTYNLYGSLFFTDSSTFKEYVDDDLIEGFMNSLVSTEPLVIE